MATTLAQDRLAILARLAAFGGIALMVSLAWAYTVMMPDMDRTMAEMGNLAGSWRPWSGIEAVFTLLMWAVMMVAMMTPSAVPMVWVFERIEQSRHPGFSPFWRTGTFLLGYVALWAGFSLAATTAQTALHALGLLSMGMKSVSQVLSGLLLIAAGAYQLSPLKRACLAKCRSPLAFLLSEWRQGSRGAFVMGLRHGLYCVGCCWLLMALLFVGGVMNLLWVGGLTIVVLLEKVLPATWPTSALGIGFAAWGMWLMISA